MKKNRHTNLLTIEQIRFKIEYDTMMFEKTRLNYINMLQG